MSAGRPGARLLWLVPLLAFAVHANTFSAGFTLDDVAIVETNEIVTSLANLPRIFASSYWGTREDVPVPSLYRPATITSYALQHALHGARPAPYHVANALLHALASLLLALLVLELFASAVLAGVAGALFAVHPVHVEAVAGVVGRAELLALCGTLGCVLAYLAAQRATGPRAWAWVALSCVAFLVGTLSKESGLLAPAVVLLVELLLPGRRALLHGRPRALVAFAGFAGVALLFAVLRARALGAEGLLDLARASHHGFAGVGDAERVWTALRVCAEYAGLLLAPLRLSADYGPSRVPIAQSPLEPGVLVALGLLLAGALLAAWSWRRLPAVAFGLGLFAVTLLPASNLAFATGTLKAERILYAPSAGLILAAAAGIELLLRRPRARRATGVLLAAALLLLSAQTWRRCLDWRDNPTLARATLATTPRSGIFNQMLGLRHFSRGERAEARPYLERALEVNASDYKARFALRTVYLDLGNADLAGGRAEAALAHYRRALELEPEYADALNNLARAQMELDRPDAALATLERLRRLQPDHPGAWVNPIAIHLRRGQPERALPLVEEALRRLPERADVQRNAGEVYRALGRGDEARRAFRRARELRARELRGGEAAQEGSPGG